MEPGTRWALGIAVGGVLAVEVVALDGAGEALADGGSGYVHALTGRKNAHGKFGAGLVFLKHGGIVHAMLIQALAGRLAGILTGERFSGGLAGRAHRHLQGGVAVLFRKAMASDAVGVGLDHGDGHTGPLLRKQARHSSLLAD